MQNAEDWAHTQGPILWNTGGAADISSAGPFFNASSLFLFPPVSPSGFHLSMQSLQVRCPPSQLYASIAQRAPWPLFLSRVITSSFSLFARRFQLQSLALSLSLYSCTS